MYTSLIIERMTMYTSLIIERMTIYTSLIIERMTMYTSLIIERMTMYTSLIIERMTMYTSLIIERMYNYTSLIIERMYNYTSLIVELSWIQKLRLTRLRNNSVWKSQGKKRQANNLPHVWLAAQFLSRPVSWKQQQIIGISVNIEKYCLDFQEILPRLFLKAKKKLRVILTRMLDNLQLRFAGALMKRLWSHHVFISMQKGLNMGFCQCSFPTFAIFQWNIITQLPLEDRVLQRT